MTPLITLRVLSFLMILLLCGSSISTAKPPRLVLFLVVDQMRADYLHRFQEEMDGGLKRLYLEGARFESARFQHAFTSTAPGHSTLATGTHPSRHGICQNSWIDEENHRITFPWDTNFQAVGAPREEWAASPRLLLAPTLGDRLKQSSPRSQVFGIAGKAKAAVALGGEKADAAFWFSRDAEAMVSSTYYMKDLPGWAASFNRSGIFERNSHRQWDALECDSRRAPCRPDDYFAEADSAHASFPHQMDTGENATLYNRLICSPFAEEILFDFSRRLVEKENLGTDEIPDLLMISCSAADHIGHSYGPFSQEVQDYYLRLDDQLGVFLQFLEQRVGPENLLVVLCSDHGVPALPEYSAKLGIDARRISHEETEQSIVGCLQSVQTKLQLPAPLLRRRLSGVLYLDKNAIAQGNLPLQQMEREIAAALQELPIIHRAFGASELDAAASEGDSLRVYFRNNYYPGRSGQVFYCPPPGWLLDAWPGGTHHGAPSLDEQWVPLIFSGCGIAPASISGPVSMVDVAPTLAEILNLPAEGNVHGKSLAPMLDRSAAKANHR